MRLLAVGLTDHADGDYDTGQGLQGARVTLFLV